MEVIAELAIRAGGVGIIAAVTLMMAFLFSVAYPLFRGTNVGEQTQAPLVSGGVPTKYMGIDEGESVAWLLEEEGRLRALQISDGERFVEADLFPQAQVTAVTTPLLGEIFCFGFADGTVRKAEIGFHTEEVLDENFPAGESPLEKEQERLIGKEHFQRTKSDSLRRTTFVWKVHEALESPAIDGIQYLDRVVASTGEFFGMIDGGGSVRVLRVRETENMMTFEVERMVDATDLTSILPQRDQKPTQVLLAAGATQAYVVYPDGTLVQVSLLLFSTPALVESISVLESGADLERIEFLPGRSTLLVSDSKGKLSSWFSVRPEEGGESMLTRIQDYNEGGSGLQSLAFSHRSRMFLAGRNDGSIVAQQATTGSVVHTFQIPPGERILQLAFHPRQNGVVALTDRGLHNWRVDFGYPEATLRSIFTPIWYEGYSKPEHVWQSSSSSDDFEPKIGMWPLVFGTIKATFFAMLFGAPIAILAALFTSEYMQSRSRSTTKTLVELLAGLPSVVLGFLAALVVAPFVQEHLAKTLSAFFLIPLVLLAGAYLWQMQSSVKRRKRAGATRQLAILICPIVAIGLAWLAGPLLESALFGGDAQAWLDHRHGVAASGWFFLLIPFAAAAVLLLFSLCRSRDASGQKSLARFLGGLALTLTLAAVAAFLLQILGFDPRGGVLDTYEQRNALVVGIAVGLVVLPIVFTLTDDTLGEVPQDLREASLGAGATQWQTAIRVVLPFATSGIFSALMVGLGRAVGETMIVLMAAGNTPLTEWNVFNGFRTLAANIATEIPEAVVGSAHYRALFFTAILLFGMTFVINTLAELVRRHFRAKVRAL
ncbi:MAG: ABC transporter permease subunit [bacterium]|nr:ABC transporter permease subunit [bacterium]